MVLAAKHRTDPELILRRIFVWSSARAGAAAHARAKKLDRARDDLGRLERGLGSRHYPGAAAVSARVTQIGRDRRVGAYLRADVGTDERGKPTLAWSFDQAALDAEAATDGWYALLTNLDPPKRTPRRYCAATRDNKSSNAATATSKAPSPSPPCS